MPNWKKVVVSGSDAILNSLYVTGPITGSDITIDDWGSISSSLASIEAGASSSNQNFQQVTDQGATTTNVISVPGVTINTTASQDFLKLGFQAGENASNSSPFGDGGVIIGTHALRDFDGTTEKVTIVGNYTADQPTNFGDLVTLVGSTIASGTNRNVGDRTTAVGAQALNGQTGGNEGNTAIGANALGNFKGGNWNIALGYNSGPQATLTGSEGIYIGKNAGIKHNSYNVPPSQSIYIGTDAKSTFGSSYGAPMTVNEIVIGNNVNGSGTNTVTIGNSSTTNNYFFGDIDADDITIDSWGSISSSLASINATGSSQNLQQVTDNGNSTTNKIIVQGVDIGRGNNTAASSVAIGDDALKSNNSTGVSNTAIGDEALEFNTTGQSNTAIGHQAAGDNRTGFFNVAVGATALFSNQNGRYNIAIGTNAGSYVHTSNLGNGAPTSSIFIGANTKASTNSNENQIVIGYEASGSGDNTVTIGNSNITDNYFSGNISGSDVTIDDWGSVSASLASLQATSNPTLQEVTQNGQTTSRDIILTNTSASFRNSSGNLSNLEHNKLEFTQGQGAGARSSIWFSSPSATTSSFEINSTPDVYEHGKPDFTIRMNPTSDTVLSSGSFDGLFIDESFTYISHNQVAGITVNDRAITNSSSSALYLYGPDAIYNQKKLVLTNITEISSSGNGDSFDVIIKDWGSVSASLATLESSANPTLQDVTNNGSTTTNSITSSDISIDDWGSVSASLASIDSNVTLQEATDNGNLTTNSMILSSSTSQFIISASGDTSVSGGNDNDTSGIITTRNISNSGQSNRDGQDSFKRAVDGYTYNTYHTEGGFGAGLPTSNGSRNTVLSVQHTKYVGATLEYTIYNMASGSSDINGARTGTAHYVFKSGSGTFSLTDTSTTDIGEDLGGGLNSFTDHFVFTGSITPGTSYFDIEILRNSGGSLNNANIVGTFKLNRRTRYTPGDDVALEIGGPETEIYTQG